MPRKKSAQRYRRALIKKNAHSSRCQGTTRGVLEHGTDLLERNARKQLHEFRDRHTVFKILEQRRNGHARAPKYPCTAHTIWIVFGSGAARPVDHARMLALPPEDGQQDQVSRPAARQDRRPYRRVRLNAWLGRIQWLSASGRKEELRRGAQLEDLERRVRLPMR